ncbi:unnamed protein product, partial [Coregonus sp. 'balchen']
VDVLNKEEIDKERKEIVTWTCVDPMHKLPFLALQSQLLSYWGKSNRRNIFPSFPKHSFLTNQCLFPVSRGAHISGKAKQVSVCYKRKCSLSRHGVVVSSCVRRRAPPAGRAVCDMANKENELTCSEEVQAIHYNDCCVFPVNSAAEAGSKMAGPGNKYSDYFTELSKDHDAMTRVLFGRNLRLNVALTLWRRNASELVAYLIRIEDTGVLLDCLPVITKKHLIVGLRWVQSVIKKWWPELSANSKSLQDSCSEDRNFRVMKQQLKELWEEGPRLSLVPGSTGEMAK